MRQILGRPLKAAGLLSLAACLLATAAFAQGTLEYPDRSTTLLMKVERLASEGPLRLTGPGIPGSRSLAVEKLPPSFREQISANRARFPQGVDLLLCCGDRLAGLPRSTRLEE